MQRLSKDEHDTLRVYPVSRRHREPLLEFILVSLQICGCRVIRSSPPDRAPFKVTFETSDGERMGVVAYAFYANKKVTKNRPADEYRFQLKYGSKVKETHELWQDPYGLYTTLLLGISPEERFFVAYDPVLHSPTKHFISLEFKEAFVEKIWRSGWSWQERQRVADSDDPIEILVGGTAEAFLRYVRFERESRGEDQGHRALLADGRAPVFKPTAAPAVEDAGRADSPYIHALTKELELSADEVLDLISGAKRLKMAVRGWVAEEHLVRTLRNIDGVTDCQRIEREGAPDVQLRYEGSDLLYVECKNVLRDPNRSGLPRVDFQRTRASKKDECSRFYSRSDFDIVAACLHALTQRWEYRFALTRALDPHKRCVGKLSNNVAVNGRWTDNVRGILGEAMSRG